MNDIEFATVTISGSDGNLLTPTVMETIRQELLATDRNPEVRGILVTGAGNVFCRGLDVAAIRAGGDPVQFASALVQLLKVFPHLSKPVVARIDGDALASGAAIVAMCDFAVAVEGALIGTVEASIGIWPMVAQVPIIKRLGARAAMENLGSGEAFTAERARELGLVNLVVARGALDVSCTNWLAAAARGGAAAAVGRPTAYELDAMSLEDGLDFALKRFAGMFEN